MSQELMSASRVIEEVPQDRRRPSPGKAVRRKVLIIDYEAPVRLLCRVAGLEPEGFGVLEAADGATGLEMARQESPDVVLLDKNLPGLDGWQVAERLLHDPATRDIPIVFFTPRAEFHDRERGFALGAVDYITKPFNPLELPERVQDVLDHRTQNELDKLREANTAALKAEMHDSAASCRASTGCRSSMSRRPHMIPAVAAFVLLLVALGQQPYGYYTFLRGAVTIAALVVAWVAWNSAAQWATWPFVGIAILFNPLAPVYLDRETWLPLDVVCALAFLGSLALERRPAAEQQGAGMRDP